jgi:hypothetical protein
VVGHFERTWEKNKKRKNKSNKKIKNSCVLNESSWWALLNT